MAVDHTLEELMGQMGKLITSSFHLLTRVIFHTEKVIQLPEFVAKICFVRASLGPLTRLHTLTSIHTTLTLLTE